MARLAERGSNASSLKEAYVERMTSRKAPTEPSAEASPRRWRLSFNLSQPERSEKDFRRVRIPETRPRLTGRDWLGGSGVCIFYFLSTFWLSYPFPPLDVHVLRISNVVAGGRSFCGVIFGALRRPSALAKLGQQRQLLAPCCWGKLRSPGG